MIAKVPGNVGVLKHSQTEVCSCHPSFKLSLPVVEDVAKLNKQQNCL